MPRFALLLALGSETDLWVRALEWTGLALLSVVVLWSWRPGQVASFPFRLRRWLTDEDVPPSSRL